MKFGDLLYEKCAEMIKPDTELRVEVMDSTKSIHLGDAYSIELDGAYYDVNNNILYLTEGDEMFEITYYKGMKYVHNGSYEMWKEQRGTDIAARKLASYGVKITLDGTIAEVEGWWLNA